MSKNDSFLDEFEHFQEAKNLRENSIKCLHSQLRMANDWLSANRGADLLSATSADLVEYLSYELHHVKAISAKNKYSYLRVFYRWARRYLGIEYPMDDVPAPKFMRPLPKAVSEDDIQKLLHSSFMDWTWRGCRDRAFVQTLYECGCRLGELSHATIHDVDIATLSLRIKHPKSNRERVALFGRGAAEWLAKWLAIRAGMPQKSDCIWLNVRGEAMDRQTWGEKIHRWGRNCGSSQNITAHMLRHSFATHLMDHGADLMAVKELMGHASITTTQIYLRVSQEHKRKIRDLLPAF